MSALSTCITIHIKKNLELSRICTPIIILSQKKKLKLLCVKNGKGYLEGIIKIKPPKNCREKTLTWIYSVLLVSYQWNRGTASFISVRDSVPHLLTQLVLPECLFLMSNMFNMFSCYDRQSLDLDKIQQKYAKLEVLVCLTVFHALPSALSYLTLQCSVCLLLLISMVILGIVCWLIYELCFFLPVLIG